MKLREYLEYENTTITAFAQTIGVSRSIVHRWLSGEKRPSPENIITLHRVTNGKVRADDFYDFDEVEAGNA